MSRKPTRPRGVVMIPGTDRYDASDCGPFTRKELKAVLREVRDVGPCCIYGREWYVDLATGKVIAYVHPGDCPACGNHVVLIEEPPSKIPSPPMRWVAMAYYGSEALRSGWWFEGAFKTKKQAVSALIEAVAERSIAEPRRAVVVDIGDGARIAYELEIPEGPSDE